MPRAAVTKDPETHPADMTAVDLKNSVAYIAKAQADASVKTIQTVKDFASFNLGSLEAVTEAGKILYTGVQDAFREMVSAGQSASAELLSGCRALATAKTIRERFELQASLIQASASWAVTQTSHFAQSGIDLTAKACAPLTARVVVAAETLATAKL